MYLHSMPPDFEPPPEFIIVCNAVRNCFREKKRALRRFCQLFCGKNVRRATNFSTFVLQIILQLCYNALATESIRRRQPWCEFAAILLIELQRLANKHV